MDLAWGVFGENFTTVGLLEEPFILVIAFASVLQSSWSPNLECRALNLAFASTVPTW